MATRRIGLRLLAFYDSATDEWLIRLDTGQGMEHNVTLCEITTGLGGDPYTITGVGTKGPLNDGMVKRLAASLARDLGCPLSSLLIPELPIWAPSLKS